MALPTALLRQSLSITRQRLLVTSTAAATSTIAKRSIHNHSPFPRPATTRTLPGIFISTPSHSSRRWNSSASSAPAALETPDYLNEAELNIFNILKEHFQPIRLEVQDISGGCGSMYALDIVSEQFKGLPVIKQHRLVNKVLGEEIKKWHGVQLKTKAP